MAGKEEGMRLYRLAGASQARMSCLVFLLNAVRSRWTCCGGEEHHDLVPIV